MFFLATLVLITGRAEAMHGDIVVDNLVYSGVQYPVEPAGADVQRRLSRLRDTLRRKGLDVAVALATTESDAERTADLFSRPQEYANDLGRRMDDFRRRIEPTARLRPARVMVVTPYGIGARGVPDDAIAAARSVPVPLDASADRVAATAGFALQRVAAVTGTHAPTVFRRAEVDAGRDVPWATLGLLSLLVAIGVTAGLRLRPRAATAS